MYNHNATGKGNTFAKFFFMIMLFIWSSRSTSASMFYSSESIFTSMIYMGIFIFYFLKYCSRSNIKFLLSIYIGYIAWYIAVCLKFREIQGTDLGIVYSTLLVFVAFYLYKGSDFFYYFERALSFLCILSLIVWGSAVVFPNVMPRVYQSISFIEPGQMLGSANFLVVGLGDQFSMGIRRNLGFTWEAGRFAAFIVVGIYFNLLLHNMKTDWSGNKPFYLFVITLISTLSTTGILAFVLILLFYIYNKRGLSRYFLFSLLIVLIPSIWSLSIVSDKMINSADVTTEIENMSYSFEHGRVTITPQRMTGLYLDFQNFIHDFWLGYNNNGNDYSSKYLFGGRELWLSNGIFEIFSKYGIFVGLFFYYQLFRSSKRYTKIFCVKGEVIFAILFIMISASYNFWTSPVTLYFVYYSLFEKKIRLK